MCYATSIFEHIVLSMIHINTQVMLTIPSLPRTVLCHVDGPISPKVVDII